MSLTVHVRGLVCRLVLFLVVAPCFYSIIRKIGLSLSIFVLFPTLRVFNS